MPDRQDDQGFLTIRQVQQAMQRGIVEGPYHRAAQTQSDRLQRQVLAGVSDLHVDITPIARTVRRWTGIPVAVGIAPTKTLAKLANRLAKKGHGPAGPVLDWSALSDPDAVLGAVPVEDIWGIAARSGARLRAIGIADARALCEAHPQRLRASFGVVVERIARELRGQACLALEEVAPPRRQLMVSRSFGAAVSDPAELRAAVTAFASRAGEKLRAQGLAAPVLTVFVQTNPFDTAPAFYANAMTLSFAVPTQDSTALVRAATRGVDRLFRAGDAYRKAGVLLPDVVPVAQVPEDLFAEVGEDDRARRRMAVLDAVNRKYGRETLRFAGQLAGSSWRRRSERGSGISTTRWSGLAVVRAG